LHVITNAIPADPCRCTANSINYKTSRFGFSLSVVPDLIRDPSAEPIKMHFLFAWSANAGFRFTTEWQLVSLAKGMINFCCHPGRCTHVRKSRDLLWGMSTCFIGYSNLLLITMDPGSSPGW